MYNIVLCNPTVGNALQKIFDCNTPCAAHKKRAGLLTYSFMVAEAGLEPTTFGFVSQGLALLAPRKHSRPARLERFTVLLVFSPQHHACIRHRRRRAASPQRA